MIYQFQHYQFDTEKLVLSSNGEIINLRNNEAKLLAFFLQHAQVVLSKEEILDAVWTNKIVGDQAVFQAISNLRQLFGEEAIRTFPKKGYQWQLTSTARSFSVLTTNSSDAASQASSPTQGEIHSKGYVTQSKILAAILMLTIICVVGIWMSVGVAPLKHLSKQDGTNAQLQKSAGIAPGSIVLQFKLFEHKPGQATLSPSSIQIEMLKRLQLKSEFVVIEPKAAVSETQLLSTPFNYWDDINSYNPSSIKVSITGRLRKASEMHHLDLTIQGTQNRWRLHLQHQDLNELQENTVDLLNRMLLTKVLWESKDLRLINAQLQLMLDERPNDLNILRALLQNSISIGDTQTALIRSKDLMKRAIQQQDFNQQTTALQVQARIALDELKFEEGEVLLDHALKIAKESGDAYLEAQCLEKYSSLHYARHQFAPLEEKLLQAIQLARSVAAHGLEADFMMALTVASYKFSLSTKQNFYFEQTKTLYGHLQLAPEKYAELEYFTAINTNDKKQAEDLLLQALGRFRPEQKVAAKERIQTQLVQFYLKQNRGSQAYAVLDQTQSASTTERFLKACILAQEKDKLLALSLAESVYQESKLGGEFMLALDAALLLAQLHQSFGDADQKQFYLRLVDKDATPVWRRQHYSEIEAVKN